MATAGKNFNLQKFVRDVIINQLEFIGLKTSRIRWSYLPGNSYKWPDYIRAVSRTVTVVRLISRKVYVKIFYDYINDKMELEASSLQATVAEVMDPDVAKLEQTDRFNISSLATMSLLALYTEVAFICYLNKKYELINEIPKLWHEYYAANLVSHLEKEGGLDIIKRWGDHIAYIDQDVTPDYIKSVYLPNKDYQITPIELGVLIKEAKSNFSPALEHVHIFYDGTLRFLDLQPLPDERKANRYCFDSVDVKIEHSDLLVRLGVIPFKTQATPEKVFPPSPQKKILVSANSVIASSIAVARRTLKFE